MGAEEGIPEDGPVVRAVVVLELVGIRSMEPSTFLAAYDAEVRRTRARPPCGRLDVSDGVYRVVGSQPTHLDNCVRYASCAADRAER